LTCRSNGVTGEQTAEVDKFERVTHVRDIALKLHSAISPLVDIGLHRSILREVGIDAVTSEIEVIDHYLTVRRGILLRSQIRLKWQSAVEVTTQGEPQPGRDLITPSCANGLPLVL